MASDDPGFSAEHEQVMAALIDAILPGGDDGRMPGGAALDLVTHVERSVRQNPMMRPVVEYGLSTIAEIAAKRNPSGIAGLPRAEWAAALREFAANDQFFLPAFLFLVYGGYYQHPRVVTALGLEPRAPHPKGYEMGTDDWSLLEPVRGRRRSSSD
jgi:gluconate 2-dehydrogenase subunit 3-like protein